jgi:hypothetical protein
VFHIGRRLRRIGRFVAGAHKPMDLEKPCEEKVTEAGRPRSTLDVRGKRLGIWANISDNEICSERNQSICTESKKRCATWTDLAPQIQGKTEYSIPSTRPAVANRLRAAAGGLRRRPLQPRCVACDADAVALRWLVAPSSRRHC